MAIIPAVTPSLAAKSLMVVHAALNSIVKDSLMRHGYRMQRCGHREDDVINGVLLSECLQHDEHLRGDGDVAVFAPLALADKEHPSVETDILPSESAHFTDPECAVVGKRQQSFVVQTARFNKLGTASLGECYRDLCLAY